MCGIAGIFERQGNVRDDYSLIMENMIESLLHRGPDDRGYFFDKNISLGHSRLSIIDLAGGKQPIFNEDNSICIVFNGEIFNYLEIRELLKKKGHIFRTKSDTEVIIHAYEQYGVDCLNCFNGQFAFAIWDKNKQQLFIARDRMGIRPLYYSVLDNSTLIFASEIKSILRHPNVKREIDVAGLNQIMTLWVNVPPTTVFKNIHELAPGHFMLISKYDIKKNAYWKINFPKTHEYDDKPISYYKQKLEELIFDSITLRLRADVPVASYLSGGIDSSIISSLVKKHHNNNLITFSVTFSDRIYDERHYQTKMVEKLDTDHRITEATYDSISQSFSDVVWFAEKPLIRSAPAPLYILSDLVRRNNIKVVLTGEGADELFGGYNIFKEDKVRRFWAKFPDSKFRSLLFSKLYHYIEGNTKQNRNFWAHFFKRDLGLTDNPYYSHLIRWNNTAQIKRFFTKEYQSLFNNDEQVFGPLDEYLNTGITDWHPLSRAQYLEMTLFLPGYLLSSQGDRMMMGHSIEGRFPFLDHKVVEFANSIPPWMKLNVLNEKYILKETFKDLLPDDIVKRQKQPYRAPINQCFISDNNSIANKMLDREVVDKYKYFDLNSIDLLRKKALKSDGKMMTSRDDMAIVAVISTHLLHRHFVDTG